MTVFIRKFALMIVLVYFLACHYAKIGTKRQDGPVESKVEIENIWSQFFESWIKGDGVKCAGFFDEGGIHYRPGAAIDKGRSEIEKTFSRILSVAKVEYCSQTTNEIEVFKNKIIEYGVYEQKWLNRDKVVKGGYFAVWRRNEQDGLKLYRLIFN